MQYSPEYIQSQLQKFNTERQDAAAILLSLKIIGTKAKAGIYQDGYYHVLKIDVNDRTKTELYDYIMKDTGFKGMSMGAWNDYLLEGGKGIYQMIDVSSVIGQIKSQLRQEKLQHRVIKPVQQPPIVTRPQQPEQIQNIQQPVIHQNPHHTKRNYDEYLNGVTKNIKLADYSGLQLENASQKNIDKIFPYNNGFLNDDVKGLKSKGNPVGEIKFKGKNPVGKLKNVKKFRGV